MQSISRRRALPGLQRRGRRAAHLVLCLGLGMIVTGCAGPRPNTEVERSITTAVGTANALTFRVEGGPLDEPFEGDHLGFADAVERTVSTDPGLQASLARVRMATADADQARLLPNPVLNVVLRFDVSGGGKPQVEASLAQDLLRIVQIPRKASASDNRLRQTAADAVTTALDLVAEVQERYVEAQAHEQRLPMLRQRHTLIDKLLGVSRSRLQKGEGVRSDVTVLDAQRVELEVEIAEVVREQRASRLRLARLIGEPSGSASWQLDPWRPPASTVATEARWIDEALGHRPDIQAIAWQLAALGDDAALARLLPWEGLDAGIDAQRDPDWAVGPSLSTPIPVFDMGQAKKARITAEQIEARHKLTLAKRKAVEEVRVAYQGLAEAQANLRRVRQELVPLQERRRSDAESLYRAGQSDVTPLFLAEQDLRAVQARALSLEQQAAVARIRLERAVGGSGVAATLNTAISTQAPSTPK